MKKLSILSIITFGLCFALISVSTEIKAQSNVRKTIDEANVNFIRWFNNGQVDSLLTLHSDDACIAAKGCGKEFLRNHYLVETKFYKFKDLTITSVNYNKPIAIEKGNWSVILVSGEILSGEYLTEWRFENKQWKMVHLISEIKPDL
jgi:hypothetical protein